jgi:hypothetical protein
LGQARKSPQPESRQIVPKTASARLTPSRGLRVRNRSEAGQFLVRFEVETVFEARDVRDALRQAQALGAVEVSKIILVD